MRPATTQPALEPDVKDGVPPVQKKTKRGRGQNARGRSTSTGRGRSKSPDRDGLRSPDKDKSSQRPKRRNRKHNRAAKSMSAIQSLSRPALQELNGAENRSLTRHDDKQQVGSSVLSRYERANKSDVSKIVQIHQPSSTPHGKRQPDAGGVSQRHSLAPSHRAETRPVDKSATVKATTAQSENRNAQQPSVRYDPAKLNAAELEAALLQLFDEEKARVEESYSQMTSYTLVGKSAQLALGERLLQQPTIAPRDDPEGHLSVNGVRPQLDNAPQQHQKQQSAPLPKDLAVVNNPKPSKQGENQHAWCLLCHDRGHHMQPTCPKHGEGRIIFKIERDWSPYRVAVAGTPNPQTVIHVINIACRLGQHFDKFNAFIGERDAFFLEINQYLKPRVTAARYRTWQTCVDVCTTAVDKYMADLLDMLNDMQFHVVLHALCAAARAMGHPGIPLRRRHLAEWVRKEETKFMDMTRVYHRTAYIKWADYEKILQKLNSYRNEYKRSCGEAIEKVRFALRNNREAQTSKKIRIAFSSLESTMLAVGSQVLLNVISPTDFPLPNIQRMRLDFEALGDADL